MVEDKDVMSIVVPSALGLSGVLLVFLGFALADLNELLGGGQRKRFAKRIGVLRTIVVFAALVTILGVACTGLGTLWMTGETSVYDATQVMFFATLGCTIAVALGVLLEGIL